MSDSKKQLSGILFLIAGLVFMFVATAGIRTTFFILACAFIVIGAALLSRGKKESSEEKK